MMDNINISLFKSVKSTVENVCRRAQNDSMLIVTEADLQAWIYTELVKNPKIQESCIHVHSQINYLKKNGRLGNIPDIVLLPSDAYGVDAGGNLHDRKGYTIWGSSIAIELKLLRDHRSDGFVHSVKKDIAKLKFIRDQHYAMTNVYSFFAASVILCRQTLADIHVARLHEIAAKAEIDLLIFNKNKKMVLP